MLLSNMIKEIYDKYRLYFFHEVFSKIEEDGEASLTMVETFSMECIQVLGEPTVQEFARLMGISAPNAAYKVNSLIHKGYIEKRQSSNDRREYHLRPTKRYKDRYMNKHYAKVLEERLKKRFDEEDLEKLAEMTHIITTELMPELEKENFSKGRLES